MANINSLPLVYLDTNVYSRPFDDQTQSEIHSEANSLLEILSAVRAKQFQLLCSDILSFEVANILSAEKRTKIEDYLQLCTNHFENSPIVLTLGKEVEKNCQVRPRDALHIASAILGQANYFLSCDKRITTFAKENCYHLLAKNYHSISLAVMNPVRFVEKILGELK